MIQSMNHNSLGCIQPYITHTAHTAIYHTGLDVKNESHPVHMHIVHVQLTSSIVLRWSLVGAGVSNTPVVDAGVRVGTDKLLSLVLPAHRLQRLYTFMCVRVKKLGGRGRGEGGREGARERGREGERRGRDGREGGRVGGGRESWRREGREKK